MHEEKQTKSKRTLLLDSFHHTNKCKINAYSTYNLIHSHASGYCFTSLMLARMPQVPNPWYYILHKPKWSWIYCNTIIHTHKLIKQARFMSLLCIKDLNLSELQQRLLWKDGKAFDVYGYPTVTDTTGKSKKLIKNTDLITLKNYI